MALGPQPRLGLVNIAGNPAYRIGPKRDDFYKRLIDLRRKVKEEESRANSREEKERLHSERTDQHARGALGADLHLLRPVLEALLEPNRRHRHDPPGCPSAWMVW